MTTKDNNDFNDKHRKILAHDSLTALCDAIGLCESPEDISAFLADLCTPQELTALSERWVIARLLAAGDLSYRAISAATGASTTTVGRVARFLQQEPHQGYSLVLERIGETTDHEDDSKKSTGGP